MIASSLRYSPASNHRNFETVYSFQVIIIITKDSVLFEAGALILLLLIKNIDVV